MPGNERFMVFVQQFDKHLFGLNVEVVDTAVDPIRQFRPDKQSALQR
jgi:hypothetical protein